jgi:large subunit ribosomal protein L10
LAAKAVADQARATQLLPFKGGLMNGDVLDADQIRAISRLPSREALYGQLVGIVASPISGLVRTLGGLVGGLAVALGQVREKKESGEIPAGEAPSAEAVPADDSPAEVPAARTEQADVEDAPAEATPTEGASAEEAPAAEASAADQAEPASEPAQDDNQADASAQEPDSAEATKED